MVGLKRRDDVATLSLSLGGTHLQFRRVMNVNVASKLQHNRPTSLIVGGEPQSERQQRSAEGRPGPPSQFLPPPSPISSPLAPSAYVTNAVLSNSGYGHYSGVTGFVSSNLPVVASDPRLSVRRPLEFHGVTSSTSYSSLSSGSQLSLATATTNSSVPSPTQTPRRTSLAPTHSSPQLKPNQEFSAVLLLEEPLDVRFDDPPYFDANRPARHMMESWDGRDETAERSAWDEVVRDNTTALKQASVQKNYSDLVDVANRMRNPVDGVTIKSRRWKNFVYRDSFQGAECVDWMLRTLRDDWGLIDRRMAFHLAHSLLSCGFIRPCPPESPDTRTSPGVSPMKRRGSEFDLSVPASPTTNAAAAAAAAAAALSSNGRVGRTAIASSAFSNPFIMPFLHSHVVCFCPCAFCVRNRRGNKKTGAAAAAAAAEAAAAAIHHDARRASAAARPAEVGSVNAAGIMAIRANFHQAAIQQQARHQQMLQPHPPTMPWTSSIRESTEAARLAEEQIKLVDEQAFRDGPASLAAPLMVDEPPPVTLCENCPFTCTCCSSRSCRNAFKRPHPPQGFVDGNFFYQFTDEPPIILLNPEVVVALPRPASMTPLPRVPSVSSTSALVSRKLELLNQGEFHEFGAALPTIASGAPTYNTWTSTAPSSIAEPVQPKAVAPPVIKLNGLAAPLVPLFPAPVGFANGLALDLDKKTVASSPAIGIPSAHRDFDLDSQPVTTTSAAPTSIAELSVSSAVEPWETADDSTLSPADSVRFSSTLVMSILQLYREVRFLDPSVIPIQSADGYLKFRRLVARLRRVDLDRMNQDSLLAFFLNIFNCLYMHTLVVSDLVHDSNNKTKRLAFMRRVAYAIGPSVYSLMDVKYGVLRAAMPFPEMKQKDRFMLLPPFFDASDPRSRNVIELAEPRVTFALCSGTKSSPRLQIYSAASVYDQLETATANYIRDHVQLEHRAATLMSHMTPSASSPKAATPKQLSKATTPVRKHDVPEFGTNTKFSAVSTEAAEPSFVDSTKPSAQLPPDFFAAGSRTTAAAATPRTDLMALGAGQYRSNPAPLPPLGPRMQRSHSSHEVSTLAAVPDLPKIQPASSLVISSMRAMGTLASAPVPVNADASRGEAEEAMAEHEDMDDDDDDSQDGVSEHSFDDTDSVERSPERVPLSDAAVDVPKAQLPPLMPSASLLSSSLLNKRRSALSASLSNASSALPKPAPMIPAASPQVSANPFAELERRQQQQQQLLLEEAEPVTSVKLSSSFEPPAHTSAADSRSQLVVRIPKLFDWYRPDFGKSSENLLQWIAQHHPDWMARCQISDYLSARATIVETSRFNWDYDCQSFIPTVRGSVL